MVLLSIHRIHTLTKPLHAKHDVVALPIRAHLTSSILLTVLAYLVETERAIIAVVEDLSEQHLLHLIQFLLIEQFN